MKIDVYPVGFFSELKRLRSIALHAPKRGRWRQLRCDLRFNRRRFARYLRERKWHELKSFFNGYLAEPTPWPDGATRCGSGWTKRRALRSLQRHVRQPGVQWGECNREIEKMLGDETWTQR